MQRKNPRLRLSRYGLDIAALRNLHLLWLTKLTAPTLPERVKIAASDRLQFEVASEISEFIGAHTRSIVLIDALSSLLVDNTVAGVAESP